MIYMIAGSDQLCIFFFLFVGSFLFLSSYLYFESGFKTEPDRPVLQGIGSGSDPNVNRFGSINEETLVQSLG